MTNTTPSIVRDVSAIFVETTTFRPIAPFGRFGGAGSKILCCRFGGNVEYRGMHFISPTSGPRLSTSLCILLHASSISYISITTCLHVSRCIQWKSKLLKISPVGDWRSTSVKWRFSIVDRWIESDIPSSITDEPLPTYQISLRSEENFFESHHWGFGQVQSHATPKLGQISKIRPDQI